MGYLLSLNQCFVDLSLGRVDDARLKCLQAIKELNRVSKHGNDVRIVNGSKFCLEVYDKLGEMVLAKEKVLWIGSKVFEEWYYPSLGLEDVEVEMEVGDGDLGVDVEPHMKVPHMEVPDIDLEWQAASAIDWLVDTELHNDLHQDLLSNCSFVSSWLSISGAGLVDRLLRVIKENRPIGPNNPIVTTFTVELFFNGCKRLISVNNLLPVVSDPNRSLTIESKTNKDLKWPALVEKAYLKVMGKGYNITGSNMAIDTYMLIGWIPEIVRISDGKLPKWFHNVLNHFTNKRVLLGIGTGTISKALALRVGLISGHDYMIHSYDENNKLLTLKNSWSNDDSRMISLSATDLFQFQYLYINWDMDLMFKYCNSTHFIYNSKRKAPNAIDLLDRPQYSMHNSTNSHQQVWILLERFFNNSDDAIIDLNIYNSKGDKVLVPKQYHRVDFESPTNSRFKLVKFTLEPNLHYTIVIHSSITCSMSLKLYNNISPEFTLYKSKINYDFQQSFDDEWDITNSGGLSLYSTAINNPQYDISVSSKTVLMILLLSLNHSSPIGFHLFYANNPGQCLRTMDGNVVAHDGYNPGFQLTTIELSPGTYRLVCSCKEAKVLQQFTLSLFAEQSIKVTKVPNVLGLFLDSKVYNWLGTTRHKIKFNTTHPNTKITFHLQYSSSPSFVNKLSNYRPSMRGSIFDSVTSAPVVINESWDNNLYGVFVDCVLEHSKGYILLVERFEPGDGYVKVSLGSSSKVIVEGS